MSYAPDGSLNVTVVSGETLTGMTAPDGSTNVVQFIQDEENPKHAAATHACGALWVVPVDGSTETGRYSAAGAINVSEVSGAGGALRVTVVSGEFDYGD